jgi:N-acetyl-gamma-glutamyl-phosphate reductase/acetylglutamate kinase
LRLSPSPEIMAGNQSILQFFSSLKDPNVVVYCDASYDALAVVRKTDSIAFIDKFICSKTAILNNVNENVWDSILHDEKSLAWVIPKASPHRPWFFERAEGSFSFNNRTLFWLGVRAGENIQKFIGDMVVMDASRSFPSSAKRGYDY